MLSPSTSTTTSEHGSTPTVALVVISDRGERYLPQCLEALERFEFPWAQRIVVEDPTHRFSQNEVVAHAWSQVDPVAEWVLHLEEDFIVNDLPLAHMVRILEQNPDLAQVVLKRQPWNGAEVAAGGIIEANPDDYHQEDGFVRHSVLFSLNPCLIPRHVVEMGWGTSESEFTARCLARGLSFAFYGSRGDRPRVEHIGYVRA